jgi:ATP adenylyltransferase
VDRLWAPWRSAYVSAAKPELPPTGDPHGPENCFLCKALAETQDRENLILLRTELSVVVLNRYPYNNGHLLVAPRRHVGLPQDLTDAETLDLQRLLTRMMAAETALMKPEGFNVGLNLGSTAGAGLPGHLHWHLVPRWNGDSNFMPVLADVRVISQSLETLWELLTEQLKKP